LSTKTQQTKRVTTPKKSKLNAPRPTAAKSKERKSKNVALTHLDAQGRPAMVDVSAKAVTARSAVAESRVKFPAAVASQLRQSGLKSAKGGVIETAIIAGTMAVKRTHELIPFCHPLPIDGIRFAIDWRSESVLEIVCTVNTIHKTGVEMEALTGATVAALTVYDMCKALSHAIVLGPTKLRGKRGGKHDFGRIEDKDD
jgi:cyclic pyranopterin monophosphate synthase